MDDAGCAARRRRPRRRSSRRGARSPTRRRRRRRRRQGGASAGRARPRPRRKRGCTLWRPVRPCLSTTAPRLGRSAGSAAVARETTRARARGGASESEVDAARWPRGPSSACWRSRALASAAAALLKARSASSAALVRAPSASRRAARSVRFSSRRRATNCSPGSRSKFRCTATALTAPQRRAKRSADRARACSASAARVATNAVLQFPPSESRSIDVSTEFR